MRWARAAVVVGAALLVAAFCFAVETPGSGTVAGHSYACDDVLGPTSLVSGQPVGSAPVSRFQRRLDAACAGPERVARWAVWGGVGLGGLAVLVGWTALRERERDELLARSAPVPA